MASPPPLIYCRIPYFNWRVSLPPLSSARWHPQAIKSDSVRICRRFHLHIDHTHPLWLELGMDHTTATVSRCKRSLRVKHQITPASYFKLASSQAQKDVHFTSTTPERGLLVPFHKNGQLQIERGLEAVVESLLANSPRGGKWGLRFW